MGNRNIGCHQRAFERMSDSHGQRAETDPFIRIPTGTTYILGQISTSGNFRHSIVRQLIAANV